MKTKPKLRKTIKLVKDIRKLLEVKTNGVTVWAAFNPKTGECMLPTVRGWKKGAIGERDKFYEGCPIYQCWLSPLFIDNKHRP